MCSAYTYIYIYVCSNTRASFTKKVPEILEDDYKDFELLYNVDKESYLLYKLWESKLTDYLHVAWLRNTIIV